MISENNHKRVSFSASDTPRIIKFKYNLVKKKGFTPIKHNSINMRLEDFISKSLKKEVSLKKV